MVKVNTILLELLKLFPRYEFGKLENRYNGNHYTKYFTGWQRLESLRRNWFYFNRTVVENNIKLSL